MCTRKQKNWSQTINAFRIFLITIAVRKEKTIIIMITATINTMITMITIMAMKIIISKITMITMVYLVECFKLYLILNFSPQNTNELSNNHNNDDLKGTKTSTINILKSTKTMLESQ